MMTPELKEFEQSMKGIKRYWYNMDILWAKIESLPDGCKEQEELLDEYEARLKEPIC